MMSHVPLGAGPTETGYPTLMPYVTRREREIKGILEEDMIGYPEVEEGRQADGEGEGGQRD